MEKTGSRWTYYLPVKLIASVLCVCAFLSTVCFSAIAIVRDQEGTEEEKAADMNERLASNYSAWILERLQTGEELPKLEDTNFAYAVVKGDSSNLEDIDLEDPTCYVAGNPDVGKDYEYSFHGREGSFYSFQMDDEAALNLWGSYGYSYYDTEASRHYEDIKSFVYAYDEGIFYFRTKEGDLPARNICIADQTRLELGEDGDYLNQEDYEELVEIDPGTAYGIHYNRYELVNYPGKDAVYVNLESGQPIDADACESWREVGFYNKNWEWCAGFDVRFVRKESSGNTENANQVEISGKAAENAVVDGEPEAGYWEEEEFMETEAAAERNPEEDGPLQEYVSSDDDTSPEEYTSPKALVLQPVLAKQLKPMAQSSLDYSIAGSKTLWIHGEEEEAPHYLVLSKVKDYRDTGVDDLFARGQRNVHLFYALAEYAIPMEILSLIVFLITFVIFCLGVGHRTYSNEVVLNWLDRVPFELVTAAVAALELLMLCGCAFLWDIGAGTKLLLISWGELIFAGAMLGLCYLGTLIARLKARSFWRNTLIHWLLRPIAILRRMMRENATLFWTCALALLGMMAVETIGLFIGVFSYSSAVEFGIALIFMGIRFFIYLVLVMQLDRLDRGTAVVAAGDFSSKISTRRLFGPFRRHAERINNIGESMDTAVQEKMKSEHLRTELITNVSHDIKTPLTSIISYVDLLQKQNIDDPKAVEYLEVLNRQSARLKKLIEDLMEASKASTGNLEVMMEKTDAVVLLGQAAGEFEERLEEKGLQLIIQSPEEAVEIMADGRHLWRIFENLLGNICKYAQPNSRVYITLERKAGEALIIFRNISSYQLNITPEELMERFVRGDSSRHTEGSGLGLSIAQSLTILMGGQMELHIDGDLFKVMLHFPLQ